MSRYQIYKVIDGRVDYVFTAFHYGWARKIAKMFTRPVYAE